MNRRADYLYRLDRVLEALAAVQEEMSRAPCPVAVAYALKAAPFAPIVACISTAGGWAEVMSEAEVRLAAAADIPAAHIVLNAPAGDPDRLVAHLRAGGVVIASHLPMLEAIADRLGGSVLAEGKLLVRVHDGGASLSTRHGVDAADGCLPVDVRHALESIRPHVHRVGLHVHGRRLTARVLAGATFARWLEQVWTEIVGGDVGWLDMGGGWSGDPGEDARRSAGVCAQVAALKPPPEQLIVEPGTRLVNQAGDVGLPVQYVDSDRGELVAVGARRLLPELRRDDAGEGFSIRGPSCMGSDRLPGLRLPRHRPGAVVRVGDVGAYNAALALGAFAGGGRDADIGFRGLALRDPHARDLLHRAGWTLVHLNDALIAEGADAVGSALAASLDLRLRPGDPGGAVGWDEASEVWATLPHTDGVRANVPPPFVGIVVEERDPEGGAVSSICRVDHVVATLSAYQQGAVLRAAESLMVPLRGGDEPGPLLWLDEGRWCARLFQPAIDWLQLAKAPDRFATARLVVTWLERAARESVWRTDLIVADGQALVIDNTRMLHWRSGLPPDSPRRGFRLFFDGSWGELGR